MAMDVLIRDAIGMDVPDRAYTHGGMFHADDVLVTALLRQLNPDMRVERVRSVPEGVTSVPAEGAEAIVYDIGGGTFDHHQADCPVRENGVRYASLGRVWEQVWPAFCDDEEAAERFDEEFVQPLDEHDNHGGTNLFCQMVTDMNPPFGSTSAEQDAAFERAVEAMSPILERRMERIFDGSVFGIGSHDDVSAGRVMADLADRFAWEHARSSGSPDTVPLGGLPYLANRVFPTVEGGARFYEHYMGPIEFGESESGGDLVKAVIEDCGSHEGAVRVMTPFFGRRLEASLAAERDYVRTKELMVGQEGPVVEFGDDCPRWKGAVCERDDVAYVTYESNRGGHNLQAVPVDPGSGISRVPLPESVRGRSAEEVEATTGIGGVTFVHASGFLAACDTAETARALGEWSLRENCRELVGGGVAPVGWGVGSPVYDSVRESVYDEVEAASPKDVVPESGVREPVVGRGSLDRGIR